MRRWMGSVLVLLGLGVAAAIAGPPAKMAAPHVRIQPIVRLDSLWPAGTDAWSPRGVQLALTRRNDLWVMDAARPDAAPRRIFDAGQWIRSASWSPDGSWLLLLTGDPSPANERTLIAVPLDGGAPDTLRGNQEILWATWGPNGQVYFKTPSEWLELPPPARWKPTVGFFARPAKAIDVSPGPTIHVRRPAPNRTYDLVCHGTFRQDIWRVVVMDALPDGSRLLVNAYTDTSGVMAVVDGDGQTVLDLDRAGIRFWPTALSSDRRLIVGYKSDFDPQSEGYNHIWLEAADAGGRWVTRIVGGYGSSRAYMSREGSFIAYGDGPVFQIGRLVVEGPAHE